MGPVSQLLLTEAQQEVPLRSSQRRESTPWSAQGADDVWRAGGSGRPDAEKSGSHVTSNLRPRVTQNSHPLSCSRCPWNRRSGELVPRGGPGGAAAIAQPTSWSTDLDFLKPSAAEAAPHQGALQAHGEGWLQCAGCPTSGDCEGLVGVGVGLAPPCATPGRGGGSMEGVLVEGAPCITCHPHPL